MRTGEQAGHERERDAADGANGLREGVEPDAGANPPRARTSLIEARIGWLHFSIPF